MVIQNLNDLISSLFDCVVSLPGCDAVKNEVCTSMKSLASTQPSVLLSSAHAFLLQHTKLSASSRAFVLQSIGAVAENQKILEGVDEQLLLLIINLVTQEMTMTKDNDTEWADSAKEVLVRIAESPRLVHYVLDALLQKFPPGVTAGPHRYIVATLGAVAEHNPSGFVPFLTDVFSRAVPILSHVKLEPMRCAWARAICAFCDAVRECESGDGTEEQHENGGDIPKDKTPDRVHRSLYSDQAGLAYDVIFGWMSSKDSKVRAEACECVGELCTILSVKKLAEDTRKLVTTMLGLYRRATSDQYHMITQGICKFLESTCPDETCPIDSYLDDILNTLFPHACLDADDSTLSPNPLAIKNHSEAFRCFHVASSRFADRIVYYLLHKMQNVQDMQKLGAINVLRHLLNMSGVYMEDKRSLVMMGLRKLLATDNGLTSIRVCRAMVQLCVALADHSYVDADGGEHVITFLVRNLVVSADADGTQTRRPDSDVANVSQLRTQCAQALYTISATCVSAHKLLWPYLLEYLCAEKYTPVVADLCKCLRVLVQRELDEGRQPDYKTGFDNARVAGRYQVMSRLFVCLCNAPVNGAFARRAREAVGLLRLVAPWFHQSLVEVLQKRCDRLEALIDEVTGPASSSAGYVSPSGETTAPERRAARVARWHDMVLTSLEATVSSVAEGEWRMELAAAMGKQLDLYAHAAEEKAFLLRCMGVVLSKITLQSFVIDHLLLMFRSTNHSSAIERGGCARGVGRCSKFHTDLVLVELENVAKWEHLKKSTGIFAFIKDAMPMRQYTDVEMVHLRATLMLSYGYVVQACPVDQISQRLDQTIIVFLRHYMANQKQETVVREALLETMHLIAVSVHPSNIGTDYRFDTRNELLTYIKDYVQGESSEILSSAIRLLACKAAAALVRLEPSLSEQEVWDLGSVLTASVLPISREKGGLKTLMYELDIQWQNLMTSSTTATGRAHQRRIEDDESATTMDATVGQLTAVFVALVTMNPTVETVTLLLKMLLPYYGKLADHERARAVDTTVVVLKTYLEHAKDIKLGVASDFPPFSSILARLTPRLVDSLCSVRLQSLKALSYALRLSQAHKGDGMDSSIVPRLLNVDTFASEYLSEEGKLDGLRAKNAIKKFAEVIEARLPQCQVQTYISAIFEMLGDRQSQVSAAAAQLLTHMLTDRGATLHAEAETLVVTLLSRLSEVHSCVQTYADVLAALLAFSAHQQITVTDVMLRQPLPYSIQMSDAWKCICSDRSLFLPLLEYLLELIVAVLEEPYEILEVGGGSSVKVVKTEACAYAAAMNELVKAGDLPSDRVPTVLAALIQLLFSVAETQFPIVQKDSKDGAKSMPLVVTAELRRAAERPAGLCATAIRSLLNQTKDESVVEAMNAARAWTDCLDRDHHVAAMTTLMRALIECRPDWVDPLLRCAMAREESTREPLRATAVTLAAACIVKCPTADGSFNRPLFEDCMNCLQKALKDSSLRIRKLSVRGMGDLANCRDETMAAKYGREAVNAAMAGLDDLGDRKDEVASEAIGSLNKLIGGATDEQLKNILPGLLLKIRPCFDKESRFLRAAAFRVFGELGARVGAACPDFPSHLHSNIVALVLHCNDEDEAVRMACKQSLHQLCPLFNTPLASQVVDSLWSVDRNFSFGSLVRDFSLMLANSFPDRVNDYALTASNYFKSTQAMIRSAAATLTGHLLGCLSPELRSTVSKDLIFSGLALLLKDSDDVNVRVATASAIAHLHQYV